MKIISPQLFEYFHPKQKYISIHLFQSTLSTESWPNYFILKGRQLNFREGLDVSKTPQLFTVRGKLGVS